MSLISIVLPAYNEAQAIGNVIQDIPLQIIKDLGYTYEIIIIDGHSKDNTIAIAENNNARCYTSPRGYGRQYKYGYSIAKGKYIISFDTDNSYDPKLIPQMLKLLNNEDYDFISIKRGFSSDNMRYLNILGNRFLTFIINIFFKLSLSDSQSGMWGIRKSILPNLKLLSNGMSFSEEIKIKAFQNFKALELPGTYSKRTGTSKLNIIRDGLSNFLFLFMLLFKK
ncbi:glycosyltransferase family 2 protein [Candidatus Margulisiibacteriota bacterium]